MAMMIESKNEINQIRNQFCERFTIQRINDGTERQLDGVPTWICAVPRREKKVTPIFSSEMLKIDESMEDPLWGLDCENLDEETGCSKSDCKEQEKAISQIASLVDISLMIETNDDPIIDAENQNDLKEMFRSTMAIRYGVSGPTGDFGAQWDFGAIHKNIESVKEASHWKKDSSIAKSHYGKACSAWRPLAERNSVQDNADTCFDDCSEFQRWIKDEIESNNIYISLTEKYGDDGKVELKPYHDDKNINDLILNLGEENMIHALKIKLSDSGILGTNPREYDDYFSKIGNLTEDWTPSIRMSTYVPSAEVAEWWSLYASVWPNSFLGSAGFGSICNIPGIKGTSICPTKPLDELEAFGESFNDMITDFGWGSAAGDRLLPIDPHRSDEFIGFDRLEVELNRRYRGPESKKHEFEREVHLRMRQEVQKQIVAKITMWLVTFITIMILATVFSEMNLPVVPNLFRYGGTKINTIYKFIIPIILISFGVYLQMRMMRNNAPEYCRINPESHHDLYGPFFGSNCYASDEPNAQSMAKCGLGLRCFLNGKEIREIKDQSNPFTNLDCQKDFSKCGDYIKAGTIGILTVMDEMAQFRTENGKPPKLTCIFDHNMILNTPIGPDISPLRCPNILRDFFYRSDTEDLHLSLGFYTSDKNRTMVKNVWDNFKEDVNSKDIQNNFKPASPDALNVVQYDQYIYDLFFSDKNLDCVKIHGNEEKTNRPKEIFETVGYDYSRMWNDDFESLKKDGWGWANKYFQDQNTITEYFNFQTDFFADIKKGYCDNKYLGDDSTSCELQTPKTMFDYVLYDRALFNINTWPDMKITPRHGRQFCEAKFTKTELYMDQDKFTTDAEEEYKHLSNALLMLSDHRNEGVYIYHQPFSKAITFLSNPDKFKYGGDTCEVDGVNMACFRQYEVDKTNSSYKPYDVYGFEKVLDDQWPTAVIDGDENNGAYSISTAEKWVNDALPYRTESKSYKGRWNKDMAVYNPSVPFYDMASRLDELLNQRTVHKPFVKQETDKHVLPFNENNAFPLFENKFGNGDFETASYRSGPFEKIKFKDQDCTDDSDCTGTCDMSDNKCIVESQYFQLLDEPIDLTNKAEVDEKCNPEKLFKEMGRRINQTQVYYKGIAKMDVEEYLTGLLPSTKDAHSTAPIFDANNGPSLDYKMAQARRHMNIEPNYQTEEYTLDEIMNDANLYDSVSKTLKSYEMDRASVAPIPDEETNLLADMPGATTFPPVPIIEMKKKKIDPFRVEGYSDSFVEYQRTETASAVLNKIRSLYKPILFDRHFADNNVFNPKMLKEYRLANPLFPGNPIDHYGHTVFSDEDTTDSWQHRLQSLRDYMNYFGDEIDNNPTKHSYENRNLNGIVFGKDRFYQSNPFIQRGKEGGVKADQGTNRTIHHFSPAITKTGPWQYAGNSYDFGFSKSKQRLREQVGDDFGKPLRNPRFHRRLLKECMQDPIKCRTFFRFKNKIGPFDDELGNGGLNKDYLAGMRAGSDGSDLNEAPETFDLYSPFIGFDNCYDSSGQLNKADKRYFTPTKHDLTLDAFHSQFEETNSNHENPHWTDGDFGKDEPFYLRHALYALMNDAFFDVLNGTVNPGEYVIPQEMIEAGFETPDSSDSEWRKKNAELWFNWRHNDEIDPLLDAFSDQMKLENNQFNENEKFSDFTAPEGWRKVLKPTDVFKMINSQLDIGGFDRTKVYPSGIANPSRWAVYYMLCPEGNKMSFDKSTFDTSSYDGAYPRTQTDKERIESGKMVPIPNALVQIVNSEDYRAKRKYLHSDIRNDLNDNKDKLEAASDELFQVRKLPSWQRWKIDDDEFAVGFEARKGHLGQGTVSTRKTITQDEYHRTSEMFDQNIFGGWLIQPSWRESRSVAPPLSLYDPMWHQEFNEEDLGVVEDRRYKQMVESSGRMRMYGQTRPYNLQELFENQIISFYNTSLEARRLDIHGNPCNDDETGDANCDRVEDTGFVSDQQNKQTHQQYSFDPTKITYWMKMARLQHFMDASKNDKYLTKVRKMGSKFNSMFGSYAKLYDQPTYRPRNYMAQKNIFKFSSEEGRNSILPCPFGFNYKFMNPREFQSDGDWWMNSNASITFNKQKMFNMYDAASFVPYFGPKNINPYSKNDPKSLFKEKEHYITNPSMLGACIDLFSGTPVQDQTGAYEMKRGLEDAVLVDRYPESPPGAWTGPGPLDYFGADVRITGDLYGRDSAYRYLDDRQRYNSTTLPPDADQSKIEDYKDIEKYPTNVWNIEWFERNDPKEIYESWPAPVFQGTKVMSPWTGTKTDIDYYFNHPYDFAPPITNLQSKGLLFPVDKKEFIPNEFALNDVPYLIDQIPDLSMTPHANKDDLPYSLWAPGFDGGTPFSTYGGYRPLSLKSPPSQTASMPILDLEGSNIHKVFVKHNYHNIDPTPEWTRTRASLGNEIAEYLAAYNPLFMQDNKDKLWRRKPTYLSHPVFAKNPELLFPSYAVPWGSPVPTYSNGSLAFVDGGFEIDWSNAINFTVFTDEASDTFEQFPISDYKWSDFYRKYFSGADDIKEHNQIIDETGIDQSLMVDRDYFKTLAMGTSFRTPGFQPHDWLYAISMESDLNGRFHDRQVGIRTDPALAQNSTIKCCDFQALDVHLGEFNKSFTPFIVDSTPYKALIPRINNFRHGIMQQGVQWGPQYRYRTTRSPARCLHPMAFRNSNIERGKCVRYEQDLIDPRRNMDYGPGAFIDGTKYIPLVNRDTFFDHEQDIGGTKIPDSPSSIWDETRKSEYLQLYLDFAPYFQDLRTEFAFEPCDNATRECHFYTLSTSSKYTEVSDLRPTAVEIILDRIIIAGNGLEGERYPPKDALKGTRRFKNFGERSIDLLDFFRHAFRPHVYATTKNEFEQQMSQMGAYLNSVDFSDGQARLNGYNPESFTEIPTGEDFGPMPIQNPSIKYGYFQDGYTNLFLKYDLGNGTYTRGIINRLNEHQHTGDNYILPTALMGGNYGMLNTYMTDMSNIYDAEMLKDNAKSRLRTNPKALEWVGDPRSGTGYHRWFGRANNYDPWTSKWWFGRTNYDYQFYQQLGDDRLTLKPDYGYSDFVIDYPHEHDYIKIPRQMLTLGTPDKGPVQFWKAVDEFWIDEVSSEWIKDENGNYVQDENGNYMKNYIINPASGDQYIGGVFDKKANKNKRYEMTYPSAAINGYEFSAAPLGTTGQYGTQRHPYRPHLWSRTLDKTGQIGESGIWEPVKWQSPGGHHLHTDYVGFKKEYTTEIQWEPDSTSLSTGHDYFLNRDLHFLHPNFNSENRKTQMHIPTGDEFKKSIDSSDASNIEIIGTGENLEKPMFDFPPTRHPMLNFFNYYPNENTNEEWHPILEYLTETTLKRFSTMECVDFGSGDGHYFSLASIDQLIQDANLQNWADVSELVKTHPRKEDYIWYEKEMYHNLGIDHSAYEQDVKRWPYQDMWDRFTKDLPIEIAKKRKYKVNMLNWVLDETKPSAHVQHPWKSIHPHNVFHNARETFDMSYLGLNKWNRTSNLEQDPVFPYRRDFSIHVNENNIKNDFGYKESLGWLTTYLPEKISTGYDDVNLLCKKMKFPYYKNPDTDCGKDDADCTGTADDPIPTTPDDSDPNNDHKKVIISRKTDLSELTFQDDFMIVGHESYERLADKLFFNIIENCRYHPQLPLDEIERQRVWLKYLADNERTFPSWREPLIENDLSDYKKVIPKTLPICSRNKNENDKTEWSYTFGMPESIQNKGCAPLELEVISNSRFDGPLRALNNELSYLAQNYKLGDEYFGTSPSDRTYPMEYSKIITDPSISFHGCPVVHNDQMLIFGAGPDMKQYLHRMYRDYDDYADESSIGKRKCERKLGEAIEKYFHENPRNGQSIVDADSEYNRIFNYLLNYKNCEAEDLEYTNLYKATVKGATDGVVIEGMHQKFYDTGFAAEMKKAPTSAKQIGYYKDKHPSSYNYKKLYQSWQEVDENYEENDKTSIRYPIFRWSYNFDYEEPPFTNENIDGHKLNFTTFDQNPIFNDFNSDLPSNFKFKKRCWLPDKYITDFAYDEVLQKYGLGSDITRKMGDDNSTELTDEVLCPPVHPRFDHDWNFRFMKGEITQMPDLSVFNDLIERYFQKRLDARTLLGVWGRFDLGTADRPMPFERWEPVTWFLNKDGNNHQGHYTAAETILDKKVADRAGPKGDAVVTSAGIYPMKTGYQSERKNRPHPFKMFVLNNTNYDKDFGVVISPDTNVTTAYGKKLDYKNQHVQEKLLDQDGFDPKFNESFFKTGLLEAFFEKNSGLEWPKGYMDSLAPEQRYSPIRMLFNQLSDQSQEVLDLNNFLGFFKGDNEMIFDRPLPNDWFVKDPSDTTKAIEVSKLILGMIASEMLSTRSTYSPKRASDSLETPKFEPFPRSRRSTFEQDSPSSTVDLSTYQANQTKVDERIADLVDKIPEFNDFLDHIKDSWLTKPEQPAGDESDGIRQDLDARNFENFLDSDVGDSDGLDLMMDHMDWNPSALGFNSVDEIEKRKEMTGDLPIGNDFITKNWYDLNLFEKFGYLPDYKNDEKADAFSLFTKNKDKTQAFNVNTPNKIKNRKMRKIDEFYRDIYLPEQLMGVAEHPYYLDLSRCHDTNWYAGKPHCPNGPKLMEWFLSHGKNVPTKSYAFETNGDTADYLERLAKNFNEKHAELLNRLPLEHTYDEILMNPASKFLSQHDLYNTLMQNPQDGLQFDFTRQHSDRAVQKDNYRSERDGNKNHEFSAYLNTDTENGEIDLSKYLNTWQEFVHPDFDSQIDVRAEHPIIWSTNAVDHIRAVFEKANQATSQHRYLNLPVEGKNEMGGLNFTQMMMDWYNQDIKTEPKDARYVHQAETISDAKLNHLKNKFFILSMSGNELSNDWWNTNTLTANEKTDTSKDGIKKQETDALQLLKRQYDHALLSAIQNVQMQDAFSGLKLLSAQCNDDNLSDDEKPIMCHSDWETNPANPFKPEDYIKYMNGGAEYADIKTQFDSLDAENDNYYASNDNKRAEMSGSNWESVISEMDDLIFLEHGYQVKTSSKLIGAPEQIKFGDLFRPVFDNTIKIDRTDFLDQMLNLNKPCPILDGRVVLFGRIRKTQEIISHNANHQNAAEEKNSQLKNSLFSKDRTSDFKNDLRGGYTNLDVVFDPLDSETEYLDQFRVQHSKEYYNIEGKNSIRNYLGMISEPNDGRIQPGSFNNVHKSYPHPYTVVFSYDSTIDENGTTVDDIEYRGMVPNSISPQWGACVNFKKTESSNHTELICLGGMICYNGFKRNAGHHYSTYKYGRDDAYQCDNMDDAPHNMVISPKLADGTDQFSWDEWNGEWETSISSENLFKMRLPIGLLGHTALVVPVDGADTIHIFGGMFSKLSSFYGYKFSREGLNEDRIDRYVHDAVADFTLVYDHTNGWTKGPELNSRRFGHTSFIYDADKKPMVYHVGGGQREGQAMNGIERWKIGENCQITYEVDQYGPDGQYGSNPYKNDPQLNEPYKWDGDAVFQSRLFFRDNQNLVAQLKRENSELDSNDIDFSQTDPNTQHIFGRAHPIKDWWLYTMPLTGKERQITSIILDKFAPSNIDHSLKFFFDHGFAITDHLFQEFNDQLPDCFNIQMNSTDDSCWSTILTADQMKYIWEDQYFNNSEIFMESPQDVTHSEIKYAPCRFCDAVSFEYAKNNLKLIQQTPADSATIEVNEPIFDDLNFNLGRMDDTCSLEKVDLPGNQFNEATQVFDYLLGWNPVVFNIKMKSLQDSIIIDDTKYTNLNSPNTLIKN